MDYTAIAAGSIPGGGGCNTLLPVELISFEASKLQDENLLEWSTASEKNTSKFIIERSTVVIVLGRQLQQ